MNGLIDGLILYLNFGQIGDYSRLIVDNMIKYTDTNFRIIKDYEIESNKYIDERIELLLDRKNNNLNALSNYIKSKDINFFHCLNNGFSIPKNYELNYIISVSNLMPLYIENLCNQEYLYSFFNKFPYSILQSESIVCPSVSCKNDLLNKFSMDSKKVIVNYGILSEFFSPQDNFMSSIYISSKFNIEKKYIIFYGDFHKRKNLDEVINLFNEIRKFIKDINLIISTDRFYDIEYICFLKKLAKKYNLQDNIIFLQNLNELDLVYLLNNAFLFIDLSSYENINLNIVNAFKMEVPIICSSIDLYKEYFGDNVFYYNNNIKIEILIDYILKYKISNKDLILSKFNKDISLKIMSNLYNKFNK